MIAVSQVGLEELNEQELIWLVQYCNKCFEPLEFENLVSRVRRGAACVYRISGDCIGLFILSDGSDGLYLETVAGRNIVRNFDELYEKIKMTALARGAKKLYSYASRDSLRELYDKKTKAKAVATLYREEL